MSRYAHALIAVLLLQGAPAIAQDAGDEDLDVDAEINESEYPGPGLTPEQAGILNLRNDGGTKGSDGWYSGQVDLLGASVRFPCQYTEFTLESRSKFTPHKALDTVSCSDGLNIRYTITRTRFQDPAAGAMGSEQMYKALWVGADLASKEPALVTRVAVRRFQGFESFDKATSYGDICEIERYILVGPTMLTLSVVGDGEACSKLNGYAAAFLNGVRLQGGASE